MLFVVVRVLLGYSVWLGCCLGVLCGCYSVARVFYVVSRVLLGCSVLLWCFVVARVFCVARVFFVVVSVARVFCGC